LIEGICILKASKTWMFSQSVHGRIHSDFQNTNTFNQMSNVYLSQQHLNRTWPCSNKYSVT